MQGCAWWKNVWLLSKMLHFPRRSSPIFFAQRLPSPCQKRKSIIVITLSFSLLSYFGAWRPAPLKYEKSWKFATIFKPKQKYFANVDVFLGKNGEPNYLFHVHICRNKRCFFLMIVIVEDVENYLKLFRWRKRSLINLKLFKQVSLCVLQSLWNAFFLHLPIQIKFLCSQSCVKRR